MTTESHIQLSALLPHPPIIVPEVGGARLRQCSGTVNACREVARQLVAARPDRLMLISPHSPRKGRKFGIWSGHDHRGNLAAFGAPGASISLPTDPCLIDALEFEVMGVGNYWRISSGPLDHGAVVPLWFLQQACCLRRIRSRRTAPPPSCPYRRKACPTSSFGRSGKNSP